MAWVNPFGESYTPTASFAFEFSQRKNPGNRSLVYLLLPPEEYSMQEGYRITLTKTAGGGFVDDFGNDFKKIKLSGSLYNYYFGYPAVPSSRPQGMKDIAKKVWNSKGVDEFVTLGKQVGTKVANTATKVGVEAANSFTSLVGFQMNVPGVTGRSGLDELFRLRYMLSRFRDAYGVRQGVQATTSKLLTSYKDLLTLSNVDGGVLFDNIKVVYHDYDDDNHFEIIFDNFTMRRSKEDPFTIYYDIEMTAVREVFGTDSAMIGVKVQRENPFQYANKLKEDYNVLLNKLESFTNLPAKLAQQMVTYIEYGKSFYTTFVSFVDNVDTNFNNLKIAMRDLFNNNTTFMETLYRIATNGSDYDSYKSEDNNLPLDQLDLNAAAEQNFQFSAEGSGLDKYFVSEERQVVYNTGDRKIKDTDFSSVAESSPEKQLVTKSHGYYLVKQGDTLQSLGNKFYGNFEKGYIIADANDISNHDFENDGMIGKNIIIPLEQTIPSKINSKNLVYFSKTKTATPEQRQLQVLGADFFLNDDREIVADGTGDLSMVYGKDCYFENISDRLKFPIGTLSPINPTWGIQFDQGSLPAPIMLNSLSQNVQEQITNDPRTEMAMVDRQNIDIEGDVLRIPTLVKPFTGEESIIDAGSLIQKTF